MLEETFKDLQTMLIEHSNMQNIHDQDDAYIDVALNDNCFEEIHDQDDAYTDVALTDNCFEEMHDQEEHATIDVANNNLLTLIPSSLLLLPMTSNSVYDTLYYRAIT